MPFRDDPVSGSKCVALCCSVSFREGMAGNEDETLAGTVEEDGV
jgi:hypothetical protein